MREFPRLSEDEQRELFALFCSPTDEEIDWIYSPAHRLYYRNERLDEEYSLTQEKREYASDAWRAVTIFLSRHGYKITKSSETEDTE